MSKPLSEEEKENNKLRREERQREKSLKFKMDERCYEILRILREAPEHPDVKYNSKFFENYFHVANITILRAISVLKEHGFIEEKQVNGSYVLKRDGIEYLSDKTRKNIALIASLKGLLQQYKNTPLYENITKFIYFLEPNVAKEDAVLSSSRVTVPPQIEYVINNVNWDKVYKAIQKNVKIRFRYDAPYSNKEAKRIVCPYQLLLDNSTGTVYVFAHSEYNNVDILYSLNRMKEIVLTNDVFELPEDFDFNSRCGGGRLGAFKSGEIEKYKIRFTGYAKYWIKEHKWADDQSFTEDDEATTITFTSRQFDKVYELILSWGTQAEPLEPQRLVDRWTKEIIALYEKIKK